ncbi:ATP-dependent RNA helicase DDX51-like [Oppia nitens]|uniref:ATP-dependent RNA helicase DDX51-like n=1 Tax=Oppia nitens TaxID=1686743 RepID=UPI0023DBF4F5|nr:ATP-dependent RNA helicase DDX51-like [Oppia nitens]
MDCFDLLSIPRFMGTDGDNPEEDNGHRKDSDKSDLIKKLIKRSKKRKRIRLESQSSDKLNTSANDCHLDQTSDDIVVTEDLNNRDVGSDSVIDDNVVNGSDVIDESSGNEDKNIGDSEETDQLVDTDSFPVIGKVKKEKIIKLTTIADKWLTQPIIFDRDISKSKSLDNFPDIIDPSIKSLLTANKIDRLFPVQQQVIPYLSKSFNNSHIIRPNDVCVCSPTGSGKTLAFVLPIVDYLRKRVVTNIRVLVVLPVRDLAIQVFQVFQTYCQKTSLKVGLAIGHKSFADECDSIIRKSITGNRYYSLVDILVATPGKLVDLIQRAEGFSLKNLEILVLDESDRMVGEFEFNWLQEIEMAVFGNNRRHHCICTIDHHSEDQSISRYNISNECCCCQTSINCKPIHKILFSATLSTDPEKLKFISLFQPILFMASIESTDSITSNNIKLITKTSHLIPKELNEQMIIIEEDKKPLIVLYLMEVLKYKKVLCFTGSVENSHRLFSLLKEMSGLVITEFSSKLWAKKRERVLQRFVSEKIDLIICTDIFARGLDIDGINCVICYDPPRNDTQYIHRIGRTARAGNTGTAITLLTPNQLGHFTIISRRVHKNGENTGKDKNELNINKINIKDSELKPFMTKYEKALKKLSIYIKKGEKKKMILKRSFKH